MRRKEFYWSLYHVSEKRQLDELRTDQVEAIHAALSPEERARWLIWKEGLVAWKPFPDFESLLEGLRKASDGKDGPKPPPVPAKAGPQMEKERDRAIHAEIEAAAKSQKFELDGRAPNRGAGPGRREGGRYVHGFEVEIVGGSKGRFRTRTLNASMNGLQLRDPIPEGLPRFFKLRLLGPDNVALSLLCSALPDKSGGRTARVKIESNTHENLLRTWLLKL